MSAYSFHMDPIRRHRGGNALERAAYQARERLVCLVTGRVFDHTDKDDLVRSAMVGTKLPRAHFWIRAELAERRYKAVVGRSFKVALPDELDDDENWDLLVRIGCHMAGALNTAADISYHRGKSPNVTANKHGHILLPSREWDEDMGEFGAKTRVLDEPWKGGGEVIQGFRKTWEVMINRALPYWAPKVSCESHATRGNGRIAKKHLGRIATEMEKRGIATTRVLYNEAVDDCHAALETIRGIEKEMESPGLKPAAETGVAQDSEGALVSGTAPGKMQDHTVNAVPLEPVPEPENPLGAVLGTEDLDPVFASNPIQPNLVHAAQPEGYWLPPELRPRPLDEELEEAMKIVGDLPARKVQSEYLGGP
jgi:hypothetical protein